MCTCTALSTRRRRELGLEGRDFSVALPTESIPEFDFLYVVTNRHVLAAADVVRVNTSAGELHIERIPRDQWFCSKTDDLAIKIINLPPELFAYKNVAVSSIMTKQEAERIKLGIGDNIFMVGRFINHEGKQRNAPLVRYGAISQMPSEPLLGLIDAKTSD